MSSTSVRSTQHPPVLEQIVEALSGLHFGAVEITVHHGRIVQIERREKVRLDEPGAARPAPRDRQTSTP